MRLRMFTGKYWIIIRKYNLEPCQKNYEAYLRETNLRELTLLFVNLLFECPYRLGNMRLISNFSRVYTHLWVESSGCFDLITALIFGNKRKDRDLK